MANGYDKNWIRVCGMIDMFRARYGRWPRRVKVSPVIYLNLVSGVLSPLGFAPVSSMVELCHGEFPENVSPISAEGADGSRAGYDDRDERELGSEVPALDWFGHAVLRPDDGGELAGTVLMSGDEVVWAGPKAILGQELVTEEEEAEDDGNDPPDMIATGSEYVPPPPLDE